MGTLFVVSTPIGNLADITLRALKILSKVDLIASEDTRKTGLLLKHHRIKKPQLLSFYEEVERKRLPQIISFLKKGWDIALVSNAGTPSLSDPGFKLIRECLSQGIKVESVPGPSAILAALTVSGFPPDKFLFLGFLPKKEAKKKRLFNDLLSKKNQKRLGLTVVFFESPHRLVKSLLSLQEIFGDTKIAICRELTKIHQEVRREKISQAIAHFEKEKPKGELTLLFRIPPE
jgi:16S rRNA (cytidine1402-2'-O)-methyltransferase